MESYSLEQARKDIAALNEERIVQLNRILASEALLKAILAEFDEQTLESLEERYDVRVLHAMQTLAPKDQRPLHWQPYLEKIHELLERHRRKGSS